MNTNANTNNNTDAEAIVHELTTRQHLTPHRPLKDIVSETVDATGVCREAAQRALSWMKMSPDRAIGRLRRTELIQLARCMYRFWQEAVPRGAASPAPAK